MRVSRISFVAFALAALGNALQPFDTWGHERIQLEHVSIHFRYSESGKPPLLLVHGCPQHSRTWTHIGPLLAEKYTVIAPDNRGMGDSSLSDDDNYTALSAGGDLQAILSFLNINRTFVFAHDKGVGLAASLALENPELIEKIILAEYPLPGYGYTTEVTSPNLYQNWQLAFFAVPEAASFFIQGREREMLDWYFFHSSYSGVDSISNDLSEIYTRSISKPGFLRSMLMYFAAAFPDKTYFENKISEGKLKMPVLAIGGEASFAPAGAIRQLFEPVAADLQVDVIPKSGHWIGDENPAWCAQRALRFFWNSSSVPAVDLAWLDHTFTMHGAFGGVEVTAGTNGTA
ncbi:uncharacterized protein LTR77_007122 [Saxophila tyrrhenica]|uniref:AB hydrolase-1 domain-containing protein n=1 Tax=Saxophila tyrrhenica TaxID=1690608 RepID=A0AAV9P3T0_9PEZI|nr:hypothetical protein LTR77_007122 [Saxophila tyrrhenica]